MTMRAKSAKKQFAEALALKNAGKFDEALARLDQVSGLPKADRYEVLVERAHTLLEMGEFIRCIDAVEKLLATYRGDAEPWYIKSLALEKLGDVAEAGRCWKRSVKEARAYADDGHACEFWDEHSYDLGEKGCWGRYELCQDALLKLDPANLEAYHEKANALSNMGRHAESLLLYDKALEMDPAEDDYPFALLNKGQALTSLGRYGEALSLYDLALTNPDNNFDRIGETWCARGNALLLAGRFEEALGSFEETAAHGYWHYAGIQGEAQAFAGLGRHAEALKYCEELLKRYPKHRAMQKLKALVLGKLRGPKAAPHSGQARDKEVRNE